MGFVLLDGHGWCTAPKHIKQLRARNNQYLFDYTKHPTTGNLIPVKMNKKNGATHKNYVDNRFDCLNIAVRQNMHLMVRCRIFTIFIKFFYREEHNNDGV